MSAPSLDVLAIQAEQCASIIDALQKDIDKAGVRTQVTAESLGGMRANLRAAWSAVNAVRITLRANDEVNKEQGVGRG